MLPRWERLLFYSIHISDSFPDGLGNTSGQVGHNLMDHHYRVGASGSIDGIQDQYYLMEEDLMESTFPGLEILMQNQAKRLSPRFRISGKRRTKSFLRY